MSEPETDLPPGFEQFVTDEIEPLFDAMMTVRAEASSRLWKTGLIGAIIGLGLGAWLYLSKPELWPGALILLAAGIVIGLIPGLSQRSKAKTLFDQQRVNKVSNFLQLQHQADGFEPPRFSTFTELELVALGDRRRFSNLITGQHNGIDFSIYEAKIEERRTRTVSSGKGTRTETYWATIFDGQLLHSPYPRKFACTTIIARDQGWFNSKGRFGKTMKPMGLADPKFEKLFEVYTTDQVEGRFLVDPTFMVRLLELEDNHKDRKTTAGFFEQSVFVALQGSNRFLTNPNKSSTARSLTITTITAFQQVFHFLTALKGKK
ncbi:hypothetical protein MNBD_ALPHA06-2122 [hydrothermal vent metagenome]|uniref:Galanin n=1 Tax=hydrothermal vent metagenome TaxID=652676 RepID=A0A3B0S6K9_9ZZZZ